MLKSIKHLEYQNVNLYTFALFCYTIAECISHATYATIPAIDVCISILKWFAVFLIVVKMINMFFCNQGEIIENRSYLCAIALSIAIAGVAYVFSGQKDLFLSFVMMFGTYGENYKAVTKECSVLLMLSIVLVVVPALLGLSDFNAMNVAASKDVLLAKRYAFGFAHVNNFGALITSLFLLFLMGRDGRISRAYLIVWIIIVAFLLLIVKTRTTALIITAGIVIAVVGRRLKSRYVLLAGMTICLVFFGLASVVLYSPSSPFMTAIDKIFSSRFSYAQSFLSEYGISVIGQPLELISNVEAGAKGTIPRILDNAYYRLLVNYGVLSFVAVIGLYMEGFKKAATEDLFGVALAVTMMAAVGISETWFFTFVGSVVMMTICAIHTPSHSMGMLDGDRTAKSNNVLN